MIAKRFVNNMAEFSQVFEDGLRARNVFVADKYDDDGRKDNFKEEEEKYAFTDESGPEEDPSLPYAGKVYLARRKKPDSWLTTIMEVSLHFRHVRHCNVVQSYNISQYQFHAQCIKLRMVLNKMQCFCTFICLLTL